MKHIFRFLILYTIIKLKITCLFYIMLYDDCIVTGGNEYIIICVIIRNRGILMIKIKFYIN